MGIDNPEIVAFTAKTLGTCIAVFCGICFYIGFFKGEELGIKPLPISDRFDIGYISPPITQKKTVSNVPISEDKIQIQKLRDKLELLKLQKQLHDLEIQNKDSIKKETENKHKTEQDNKLIDECIGALVSLGEKKTSAKKIVKEYFEKNPNTKTVNDFITGVFKK